MDGNHIVEFRERILFHWNYGTVMAGVVHQDIDAAEFFARLRNDASAVRFFR